MQMGTQLPLRPIAHPINAMYRAKSTGCEAQEPLQRIAPEYLAQKLVSPKNAQELLAKRVSEMTDKQCAIVLRLIDAMDRMATKQ